MAWQQPASISRNQTGLASNSSQYVSTRLQAASTLSPSLATQSLRQSRYSPSTDDFSAEQRITLSAS